MVSEPLTNVISL